MKLGWLKLYFLPNDFDMNLRIFCGNLEISPLDGCDVEEAGCDRIEFRVGWWLERHISTPWRDPDGLRRANVDNIKLERGHGRDPSSVALISIDLPVRLGPAVWPPQFV